MDVFQELEYESESFNVPEGYVENCIRELNSMFSDSGSIFSEPCSFVSNKWYNKPSQKEAAGIWDQCGFLSRATESMIESGLWEWASTYGDMIKQGESFYVHWCSPTTKYSAKWSAFYRWFICTLGKPIH